MIDPKDIRETTTCNARYIPPKPELLARFHQLMRADSPDLMKMSDLISHDVGLSAAVLKNINSAFFGLKRCVTDIKQAVVLLGTDKVANLISAYELRRTFSSESCITLGRFWDSSSDIAEVSTWITRELSLSVPVEDVFTIGLFHDCGIPIMATCFNDYRRTLIEANSNYETPILEIENKYHDFNHAIAGYMLTDSWGLPDTVCQAVLQHHEADIWEHLDDRMQLQAMAALKLAENLVDRFTRSCENIDWNRNQEHVFKILNLSPDDFSTFENRIYELKTTS